MTTIDDKSAFLESRVSFFSELMRTKFERGAREHSTPLSSIRALHELEQEQADSVNYSGMIRDRIEQAIELIEAGEKYEPIQILKGLL